MSEGRSGHQHSAWTSHSTSICSWPWGIVGGCMYESKGRTHELTLVSFPTGVPGCEKQDLRANLCRTRTRTAHGCTFLLCNWDGNMLRSVHSEYTHMIMLFEATSGSQFWSQVANTWNRSTTSTVYNGSQFGRTNYLNIFTEQSFYILCLLCIYILYYIIYIILYISLTLGQLTASSWQHAPSPRGANYNQISKHRRLPNFRSGKFYRWRKANSASIKVETTFPEANLLWKSKFLRGSVWKFSWKKATLVNPFIGFTNPGIQRATLHQMFGTQKRLTSREKPHGEIFWFFWGTTNIFCGYDFSLDAYLKGLRKY